MRLTYSFILLILLYGCSTSVETISVDEIDRFYTYGGYPQSVSYPYPIKVLENSGYVSGYDEVRGNPVWVGYRVFRVDEYVTFDRPSRFLIDQRTTNRISHDDYTNSGYDRGHMSPNFGIVTRYGQESQRETFLMTNIIPQRPSLNRQWWERLERLISRDYSEQFDEVWVLTGPVYKTTGEWINGRVKVPSHNYMIIKTEVNGRLEILSFLVHQEVEGSEKHTPYLTTVREIERVTGLNFNPLFEQSFSDSIETVLPTHMWVVE